MQTATNFPNNTPHGTTQIQLQNNSNHTSSEVVHQSLTQLQSHSKTTSSEGVTQTQLQTNLQLKPNENANSNQISPHLNSSLTATNAESHLNLTAPEADLPTRQATSDDILLTASSSAPKDTQARPEATQGLHKMDLPHQGGIQETGTQAPVGAYLLAHRGLLAPYPLLHNLLPPLNYLRHSPTPKPPPPPLRYVHALF